MKGLKPGRPGKAGIWGIPREGLLAPWPRAGKFGTGNLFSLGDSLFSLGSIGVPGLAEAAISLSTGP